MALIDTLERRLASGQDDALLRFGLGNAYLAQGNAEAALQHLAQALRHDPGYSAAWKLYGRALSEAGKLREAMSAYAEGIAVAERKGDLQAAREMTVFLKRLEKARGTPV